MNRVEHTRQVGVDHLMPLFGRHFVEWRIAGDTRIGDNNINWAKISLNLGDTRSGIFIRANIPFIGFDACGFGEFRSFLIIARIGCSNLIAFGL